MSPSESARPLGRMHQRKAGKQVKFDINRRENEIIVVEDDIIVVEDDDIMVAIREILD